MRIECPYCHMPFKTGRAIRLYDKIQRVTNTNYYGYVIELLPDNKIKVLLPGLSFKDRIEVVDADSVDVYPGE